MNKKITFFSVIVLVGLVLNVFALPYNGQSQTTLPLKVKLPTPQVELPAFAAGQLVVKFKNNAAPAAVAALKEEHGVTKDRPSRSSAGFVTLTLPEGANVMAKAAVFSKNPLVEYAHPDFFVQEHFVPNDPIYPFQWHFDDNNTNNPGGASSNPFGGTNGGGIGMEQAWDITTGASSVVVAVLDSGAAYENYTDLSDAGCYNRSGSLRTCRPLINTYFKAPDLSTATFIIHLGSDFVNNDNHPNDDRNHGTHVTGTVAQSTHNSLGVAGMAFNTKIMPVKVLDANGSGLASIIADAIHFSADKNADVINMSLGSSSNSAVLEAAVAYAFNEGVTVVTSAGNKFLDGNPVQYPAAYNAYVIAVGATDYREIRAPYSSTGSYVDVVAPGGNTSRDDNEDTFADGVLQQTFGDNSDTSDFSYWFFQGTSMASPHVAALAALIKAVDNTKSPTQIRQIIESTAEEKGTAGPDNEYGHGLIDAAAALASMSAVVSITVTTDGLVEFGSMPLDTTQDTGAGGLTEPQTIRIDSGPADLDIKSTVFADNGNVWSLAATNGANQVKWEFSPDDSNWTTFLAADTLNSLASNLNTSATQDFYLRLTTPTATDSGNEYSTTITIVASQP